MFKKLPALLFIVAGLLAVRVSAQTTLTYTITGQFYSGRVGVHRGERLKVCVLRLA